MSTDILRRRFPILGAVILLAVLIAGCTGSPYGTTPTTTQATTAPTPAVTTHAPIVKTTAPTLTTTQATTASPPAVTTQAPTLNTTVPTPQITTTTPNQPILAITIKNFAFTPQFVTISNGTTVTWTNQDSKPHQIVNDPYLDYKTGLLFKSNSLGTGQSYSFTFTMTGTFVYHSYAYPAVTGKITVI